MTDHRLYRDTSHSILAGVCSGLAEYFQTDPTLVRIIFIILCLFGASGVILYAVLWIFVPDASGHSFVNPKPNTSDHTAQSTVPTPPQYTSFHTKRTRGTLGFFIIVIGLLILINNVFPDFGIGRFWPLVIILFGLVLLAR
jgi:phage shock protein C